MNFIKYGPRVINMSKKNKILYYIFVFSLALFSRILLISSNIDQYDTAMLVNSVKTRVLIHAPGYVPFIMLGSIFNILVSNTVLCFSLTNTILFLIVTSLWIYHLNKNNIDKYSFIFSLMFIFTPSTWLYSVIGMSDGSQFALSSIILILMFFVNTKSAKDTKRTLTTVYFIYSVLLGIKSIHIIIFPIILLYTYQLIHRNHLSWIKYFFLSFVILTIGISSWLIPQKFYYDDSSIKNNSISIIKIQRISIIFSIPRFKQKYFIDSHIISFNSYTFNNKTHYIPAK